MPRLVRRSPMEESGLPRLDGVSHYVRVFLWLQWVCQSGVAGMGRVNGQCGSEEYRASRHGSCACLPACCSTFRADFAACSDAAIGLHFSFAFFAKRLSPCDTPPRPFWRRASYDLLRGNVVTSCYSGDTEARRGAQFKVRCHFCPCLCVGARL